jgi:hypothetical protein
LYTNPGKRSEDAVAIINDAVTLRNDLYNRVNKPEKESVKAHYKAINQDLLSGVDSLFHRISDMVK